jgi:hypothetical protein
VPEPDLTAKSGPIRISVAAQLEPIWRHGRAGEGVPVDVKLFAEQMTAYLAQNLEGFADPRGGDVFVAVSVQQGDESAGHAYRSGHYVKESAEVVPEVPREAEEPENVSPQTATTGEDGEP